MRTQAEQLVTKAFWPLPAPHETIGPVVYPELVRALDLVVLDAVVVRLSAQIADVAERFLKKGAKVYVEGQLQTRKWTDQGGQEHYTTEVVLSRFKGELTMLSRANNGERPEADGTSDGGYLPRAGHGGGGDLDDEIPFAPQVL